MSEWWLSQRPDPPSLKDQGLLSGFSIWVVCLGSTSAFSVRVFHLGCLSWFSIGVFRQRLLSGFSVSVFCQGFPSGVFVWVLRQRLLSGFSVWGFCLGSLSGFSVWGVCLCSLSTFSVRVFLSLQRLASIGEVLGFRCGVVEASVLLGCDSSSLGNWFPTLHDDCVVSSSRVETFDIWSCDSCDISSS
jgi:hypothetical protein